MLILFLRAMLLYCFILVILRMTGKRQVSDLEPYDLLITMSIADLASFAIADTSIPLLYSIVPILALYLVQQVIAKLCLHSRSFRCFVCGSPLVLIRDGVLQEQMMKTANYTVTDLCDHLRPGIYLIWNPSPMPYWRPTVAFPLWKSPSSPGSSRGFPICLLPTGSCAFRPWIRWAYKKTGS